MSHNNTVLSQMLKLNDRHDFQDLEKGRFWPQRQYHKLSRWGQFTVMLLAQIAGRAALLFRAVLREKFCQTQTLLEMNFVFSHGIRLSWRLLENYATEGGITTVLPFKTMVET